MSVAIAPDLVERIHELRYEKHMSGMAVARELGIGERTVYRYAPANDLIDVQPLAQAFERTGMSSADAARNLGWSTATGADGSRVLRALGLLAENNRGRKIKRQRIGYDLAVQIARAADIDPVDVGI